MDPLDRIKPALLYHLVSICPNSNMGAIVVFRFPTQSLHPAALKILTIPPFINVCYSDKQLYVPLEKDWETVYFVF